MGESLQPAGRGEHHGKQKGREAGMALGSHLSAGRVKMQEDKHGLQEEFRLP